jgi:hypothetical protein
MYYSLFYCIDFALLLFLSAIIFLLLTSFLVRIKILDQFCHNDASLQVLLINNN